MALLLLHRHATVTICHSRTRDLAAIAREADILVAAIGRVAFVTRDFVKPGATVVDVGITSITDRATVEKLYPAGSKRRDTFEKRGALTVGDVHPNVAEVAGALTPVPGGVGPLTIAMLLKNTLTAAIERAGGQVGLVGEWQIRSACGHASPRPCKAEGERRRQFAAGVGPRRQ